MTHTKQKTWFAWFPVQCENGKWVFWKRVIKEEEHYDNWYMDLHLGPEIRYKEL